MTSFEWSPTTTIKLLFFSWAPLRKSACMRGSLALLAIEFNGGLILTYNAFVAIVEYSGFLSRPSQ